MRNEEGRGRKALIFLLLLFAFEVQQISDILGKVVCNSSSTSAQLM